jgi:hypothetical protein
MSEDEITFDVPKATPATPLGERLALELFGVDIGKAKDENRCVPEPIGCGKPIKFFTDNKSRDEYAISGLCQKCQDEIFGGQE